MDWFKKKSIAEKKKEVPVLEQEEERFEKKDIKQCEKALHSFTEAGNVCAFTNPRAGEKGIIAFNRPSDNQRFLKSIDETHKNILAMRKYGKHIVKLAQNIENDLVDIYEIEHDKKHQYLSNNQLRVIGNAKDICKHIDHVIAGLKKLSDTDMSGVMNAGGYINPKDKDAAAKVRVMMLEIHRNLNGLHKMLVDLYELEKEMEKITLQYLES